jgi:hypothetical protein
MNKGINYIKNNRIMNINNYFELLGLVDGDGHHKAN